MIRILNGQLEKKLQDGRAWLAGKKLTIADFIVAACYHSVVLNDNVKHDNLKKVISNTIYDCPLLMEWLRRFTTELKPYLDARPKSCM